MKHMAFLTALCVALPAQAADDDLIYVSSFGDDYRAEFNDSGAVFTSLYPKAWFIEDGTNSHVERGTDVITFGTSCDASHPVFGEGTWWWANGGFGADFEWVKFRFPRQEFLGDFGLDCRG